MPLCVGRFPWSSIYPFSGKGSPGCLASVHISGGIFLDMTIHDFDMTRYLMDREVEEVYAMRDVLIDTRFKDANDIDTVIITLKFENSAIGTSGLRV